MPKVLILFAHPAFERSRIHARLLQAAASFKEVTIHDLYQVYPDFDILVKPEQRLLEQHDVIIFQHPFYWYSGPALLKQWMDLVLEHGWAYGHEGTALKDKKLISVISAGGTERSYTPEGHHGRMINELLAPFEQTAKLCHMQYMPPFVVHGANLINDQQLNDYVNDYTEFLKKLTI